jgi:hypothetical protein
MTTDIVTAPIPKFKEASGLGMTKIYELLNSGELQSITIGKRRLIVMASWHRLIERQIGKPAESPAASPPRPARRRPPAAAGRGAAHG